MAREPVTQSGELRPEARPEQECARADGPSGDDNKVRLQAILPRRPLGGRSLGSGWLLRDPDHHRALLDPERLGTGDDLHPSSLGRGKLDPVRPLLGGVRAAQVAEARSQAALHVHRELERLVSCRFTAFHEQAVVLVDLLRGQQMNVVLLHVPLRASHQVAMIQTRHRPFPEDALWRGQRRSRVDHRRAPHRGGRRRGSWFRPRSGSPHRPRREPATCRARYP